MGCNGCGNHRCYCHAKKTKGPTGPTGPSGATGPASEPEGDILAGGLLGYSPDDDSFLIVGAFGVLGLETVTIAPGVRGWGALLTPEIADGNPHWVSFGEQQVGTDPSNSFSVRFIVGSFVAPFRVDFFLVDATGTPIDPSTVLVPSPPYPIPGFGHFHVHRGGLATFSAPG